MREPVLNSAAFGLGVHCLDDALEVTADLEIGLIALYSSGYIQQQLRLHAAPWEIEVTKGVTLHEVFRELCRRSPDQGRFLMRMVAKFPIDNNVSDNELEALIDWRVQAHPDSLSLVMCALSDAKLAISLTKDDEWKNSPIHLLLYKGCGDDKKTMERSILNLYSYCNARNLLTLFSQDRLNNIDPVDLWNDKHVLFPNLVFAPRVKSDFRRIGPLVFRSAVGRLVELNRAAADWAFGGGPAPRYLSKVTGESVRTMQQYGHEREFLSAAGTHEIFEMHARLADGHRLHLRELYSSKQIEVGYIGRHLSIVSG